jgi:hypothetical protein
MDIKARGDIILTQGLGLVRKVTKEVSNPNFSQWVD